MVVWQSPGTVRSTHNIIRIVILLLLGELQRKTQPSLQLYCSLPSIIYYRSICLNVNARIWDRYSTTVGVIVYHRSYQYNTIYYSTINGANRKKRPSLHINRPEFLPQSLKQNASILMMLVMLNMSLVTRGTDPRLYKRVSSEASPKISCHLVYG